MLNESLHELGELILELTAKLEPALDLRVRNMAGVVFDAWSGRSHQSKMNYLWLTKDSPTLILGELPVGPSLT
jgi:hypothetical protein